MLLTHNYNEAFRMMFQARVDKKSQQYMHAIIGFDVYLELWARNLDQRIFAVHDLDKSSKNLMDYYFELTIHTRYFSISAL